MRSVNESWTNWIFADSNTGFDGLYSSGDSDHRFNVHPIPDSNTYSTYGHAHSSDRFAYIDTYSIYRYIFWYT